MPLHLLGKKSWNVYNPTAIARVRQDEADAQAREEAAEQRMQEQDAERRIALLRGEEVAELPEPKVEPEDEYTGKRRREREPGRERKRRRLRGEDETDMEMRFAREDAEAGMKARERQSVDGGEKRRRKERSPELVDGKGHMQLFAEPEARDKRERGADTTDAEARKARKQQHEEDKAALRFSNAAGYGKGTSKPWYAAGEQGKPAPSTSSLADVQEKDVWGNEDPRRKEREQSRISSNDPFAAMQMAQRQLKQSEREREKWRIEKEREIKELRREEDRRRRKHRRRKEEQSEDELEGFSLNAPARKREEDGSERHRRRHRHHSEHGSGKKHRHSYSND